MAIDFPTSPSPGQQVTSGSRTWTWSGTYWANNTITGVQGTQGIQGTQGTQGVQGIQGLLGTQGLQGIQGIQGITGAQGITGIQGTQGTQGLQGIMGAQGTQGTQGAQGIQGTQGTQGLQGITGAQGISGASILGTANTWTNTNAFTTLSASSTVTFRDTTNTYSLNVSGVGGTQLVAFGNAGGVPRIQAFTAGFAAATGLNIQPSGGDTNIGGLLNVGAGLAVTGALSATGNVGIGTAASFANLTVGVVNGTSSLGTGIFRIQLDGNNGNILGFGNGQYTGSTPKYNTYISNTLSTSPASNTMIFNISSGLDTVASNVLVLNGGGNVGIGTASPTATFTLAAANNFPFIHWNNSSNTNIAFAGWHGGSGGGDDFRIGTSGTKALTFQTNNTERARIDSSGNVGIGTASPFADSGYTSLDIRGSSTGSEINLGTTATRVSQIVCDTTNGLTLNTTTATPLRFFTNGSERARIDSSGNVGIGTTAPLNKLDVFGDGIRLSNSGSYDAILRFDFDGVSSDSFKFQTVTHNTSATGLATQMVIKQNGNVGIGTTGNLKRFTVKQSSTAGDGGIAIQAADGVNYGLFNTDANNNLGLYSWNGSAFQKNVTINSVSGDFTLNYGSNVLMRQSRPIDLSALNTSYYYPVRLSIGPDATYRFRIENGLNSNVPSWATHGGGFTIFLDWEVNGSGWGTEPICRKINKYFEAYTSVTICGGITQMSSSSYEVVWLRGGGIYNFYCDRYVNVNVETSSFTRYDQTVAPQTSIVNVPWDTTDGTVGFGYLNVHLNASVGGSLSKGSGSFRIEHPLSSKSKTHELVHSFIEGPQADLIYRGKVVLVDGKASVNIDTASTMTEGTFEVLCRDVQCFTTNESGWTAVRGKVTGNILTIEAKDADCVDEISWMVIGERKDKHMLDTEWTDDNGKVIVEPLKPVKELAETRDI